MQRGGEFDSCIEVDIIFGEGGCGDVVFGVLGVGVLGAGAAGVTGGGVCGLRNSSDVRAGLPRPDSLACDSGTSSDTPALGVSTLCDMSSDTDSPVVVSSDTDGPVRSNDAVAVVSGGAVDSVSGVKGAVSNIYMFSWPISVG